MRKFEHKGEMKEGWHNSIGLSFGYEKEYLDRMSSQGWELVSVLGVGLGTRHIYYWKREILE